MLFAARLARIGAVEVDSDLKCVNGKHPISEHGVFHTATHLSAT